MFGPAKSYVATFPTGKNICDRSAVSVSHENSDGLIETKEKSTCQETEVRAEEKLQASCNSEPSYQTVLKLSFSEDQSFSGGHSNSELNASDDEQSLSEGPHPDKSDAMETEGTANDSEVTLCGNVTPCSCSEDEIEPTTDEELRLWQYPQGQVWEEEEEELRVEGGGKDAAAEGETDLESTRADNPKEPDQHQDCLVDECRAVDLSVTEVTVSSVAPEELGLDCPAALSADKLSDQLSGGAGTVTVRQGLNRSENSPPKVGEDDSVSAKQEEEARQGVAQLDSEVEVQLGTQPELQGSSPRSEGDPLKEEQYEGSVKGGESLKKVTFFLEPELIGDSASDLHSSGRRRSSWSSYVGVSCLS